MGWKRREGGDVASYCKGDIQALDLKRSASRAVLVSLLDNC